MSCADEAVAIRFVLLLVVDQRDAADAGTGKASLKSHLFLWRGYRP